MTSTFRRSRGRVARYRRKAAAGEVLTQAEIHKNMDRGRLVIEGDPDQVRGCSYDLRVGAIFWEDKVYSAPDTQIVIPPGGVVAILTKEELKLPNDMFATAFAINKMSSKGFLVVNPGHIDPGFCGALTVKALNIRKVPMTLEAGASIFTVLFQRLSRDTVPYNHNPKNRKSRERDFNETTVETSPRTIFDMMALDRLGPYPSREEVKSMFKELEKEGPFPTRERVKELIRESRLVWWTGAASIATLFVAIAALVFAIVAAYKSVYPAAESARYPSSLQLQAENGEGDVVPPEPPFQKPTRQSVSSKSRKDEGTK